MKNKFILFHGHLQTRLQMNPGQGSSVEHGIEDTM